MKKYLTKNHLLITDPPRKGLSESVLHVICKTRPKFIIYLSCNPSTLARDTRILVSVAHYNIQEVIPIDFFPQTTHLECLLILKA